MGEQAHAMRSVVVLAAVVVAALEVEALANDPPEADGMGAPGAGVTTTTDISSVTASNFYNDASSANKAVDNNAETFWSSQLGQSNGFVHFTIAEGKPLHHVKSVKVSYYGKRSARLSKVYYRCEQGRTLTLMDERPYAPIGKLGDLKKDIRYTFKLSDDLMFTKTIKHTDNSGRDEDCFEVYDPDRDMTEGEGARIQEFLVHMEGAQQQLNGQDVLSISEIAYSTENGCENPISVALNTVMEREL